jgi:hypothetical protein
VATEEKMSGRARAAIAVLIFCAAANAVAQENGAARALASNYQLADALGERKCAITLETRTAPGGFALSFDRTACRAVFAHLADVAAWQPAPAGGINLVTAKGVAITEFTEGVGGVYEAIRDNDGVYFLTNLRIADTAETKIEDLAGEWNLSRPDGPTICKIALTKEVAGDNRFAIRVAPGCDSAITAFGPVSWQLSNGDVVLYAKNGEIIRLGRNEEGVWARVPDQKQSRPRPLLMTR